MTVPLTVVDGKLTVPVTVGGMPLRVRLDTGSVGLRVLGSRVPAAAARLLRPAPVIAYASGERFTGSIAVTTLRIGPVTGAAPTPVELVTGTDCVPDKPACSASNGAVASMFRDGVDGILGIRISDDAGVPNPLWSFGALGRSYVVHDDPAATSSLVLGVPADGFVLEHAPPAIGRGVEAAAGEPAWTARFPLCLTVTSPAAMPPVCTPTLLDTGTPALELVRTPSGTGEPLPDGTVITFTTPDHGWSAGYRTGPRSLVRVGPAVSDAGSVAGLPAFAGVDVRFDLVAGTVGFRPR